MRHFMEPVSANKDKKIRSEISDQFSFFYVFQMNKLNIKHHIRSLTNCSLTWWHSLDSDWMRTGVQDSSDITEGHSQHRCPSNLQDDVAHRGSAPGGGRDERELAIVSPAPDGQPQLPRATGAAAQRDEALLHLQTTQRMKFSQEMVHLRCHCRRCTFRYLGAPVQLLHRRFRHGGWAADTRTQEVTERAQQQTSWAHADRWSELNAGRMTHGSAVAAPWSRSRSPHIKKNWSFNFCPDSNSHLHSWIKIQIQFFSFPINWSINVSLFSAREDSERLKRTTVIWINSFRILLER